MRVLVTGDIHGRYREYVTLVTLARDRHGVGAAIQTGDFGFFRQSFERAFDDGVRFPVPVYVIDGNHEDHAWLDQAVRTGVAGRWKERHDLHFQPRGSVVRLGSSTVGFLGGALHVDRPQYRHWFRSVANFVLTPDRTRAAAAFHRERPDLLITHTCPAQIGIGLRGNPELAADVRRNVMGAGFDPGPIADRGEQELTLLWNELEHRPAAWCFGHFHVHHDRVVEGTRFVCAGLLKDRPLLIWDTETRILAWEEERPGDDPVRT